MKNSKTNTKIKVFSTLAAVLFFFTFFSSSFGSSKDFFAPEYGENFVYMEYKYVMHFNEYSDACFKVIIDGLFCAYDYAYRGDVLIVGIEFFDGTKKLFGLNSKFMERYFEGYISSYKLIDNIYVLTLY